MYRECFEKIFMKKKLKKSKGFQIQKETEMKFFIFLGKIILLTNQITLLYGPTNFRYFYITTTTTN
jgi:hypothetical protein